MALCSSSYNPLSKFSNHVYEDRGSHRDKLISRANVTSQDGFRAPRHQNENQMKREFTLFNSQAVNVPNVSFDVRVGFDVQQGKDVHFPHIGNAQEWVSDFSQSSSSSGGFDGVITPQLPSFDAAHYANFHLTQAAPQSGIRWGEQSRAKFSRLGQRDFPASAMRQMITFQTGLIQRPNPLDTRNRTLPIASSEMDSQEEAWEAVFAQFDGATTVETSTQATENLQETNDHLGICERKYHNVQTPLFTAQPPPPLLTEYKFHPSNPFLNHPSPLTTGLTIIYHTRNFSAATLSLEAACQSSPTSFSAWKQLGCVLSENDRDRSAICALKEALKLQPDNLDVIIRLAILHTNEGDSSLAYEYLENWLRLKYPSIPIIPDSVDPDMWLGSFERLKNAFISAARLSPVGENMDPDVQVGLGALFFSVSRYQLAADCFAAAISSSRSTPILQKGTTNSSSSSDTQLHLLWNRYGACLGNIGKYLAAVEAYEMALAINPNFIRAKYNLGVLHFNEKKPMQGARYLWEALREYRRVEEKRREKGEQMFIVKVGTSHGKLEDVDMGEGEEPKAIWEMLRKCCRSLGRGDLEEMVGPEMDLRAFGRSLDVE